MSRTLACAAVLVLCAAAPAAAKLPARGALVPDRSLGGIRLGETQAQVRAALGSSFGVCRGCARTT
jgi:outer membrane protein assembly factor BamE (lipoprotein component of BamABCDE complex)